MVVVKLEGTDCFYLLGTVFVYAEGYDLLIVFGAAVLLALAHWSCKFFIIAGLNGKQGRGNNAPYNESNGNQNKPFIIAILSPAISTISCKIQASKPIISINNPCNPKSSTSPPSSNNSTPR